MSENREKISEEELEELEGEPLPDREEMALWPDPSGNFTIPIEPPAVE